ncbi:MAG: hypothetical protein M0P17_02585 [Methanoculleus sp.]|nr:hypothetical protein [Methanoculleus sp.]
MKSMFGILALMVIASIMIAGCVQPAGNETVTPGTTPGLTQTPMATETPMMTETPMATATTPIETETPMTTATTPMETGSPMATTTTMETGTTVTPGATTTTLAPGTTETPPGPPAAVVADETISITDGGFAPSSITVPSGTTVGWTNDGEMNQTVSGTGDLGFFDSGLLEPGESFSYTFRATGNYTYISQTSGAGGIVIVTANTTT